MLDFNISSRNFRLRPIVQADVPPPSSMKRAPSYDYFSMASGPRQYNARLSRHQARGAALQYVASAVNQRSVTGGVSLWLKNQEQTIRKSLQDNGHSAFVVQVNYAVSDATGNQTFMLRSVHLLGTVPTSADAGRILTPETLYGPQMDATPSNASICHLYVYLLGEAVEA